MKRSILILVLGLAATSLAACGGGGSSAGGSTLPVLPTAAPPVVTPTPTPTAAPSLSGKVFQVAGPLASNATGTPAPSATFAPGAAIAGATVYVTANGGQLTNGIPSQPLATATTGSDGSFTIPGTAIASANGTVGVVVVYGTTISATTGATDKGFTVAHASVTVIPNQSISLYVDTLTPDEQSAFTALNADRAQAALPAVSSDTIAQAAARLIAAQMVGQSNCGPWNGAANAFAQLGGIGNVASWEDTAGPNWAAIINYESPWNAQTLPYAGLAAQYNAAPCGTGFVGPINYFAGEFVL
jgi:hypothetical protein